MRARAGTKICLASSVGGHLQELRQLRPVYERHPHFYVVNESISLPEDMQGRTYLIKHSERDLLFFWNLWEAFRIFRRERPTLLISTGAGLAVPLAIVGRLFKTRVLYIETFCAVYKPSLSGRLMYYLSDKLLYQWRYLGAAFRQGTYAGSIFAVRNGGDRDAAV